MSEHTPVRVQLSRKKGWKMPPNTVSVARPNRFGNPFQILNEEGYPLIIDRRSGDGVFKQQSGGLSSDGSATVDWDWDEAQQAAVDLFRELAVDGLPSLAPLTGKNLACWCRLDQPCHADVLLKLANPTKVRTQGERA